MTRIVFGHFVIGFGLGACAAQPATPPSSISPEAAIAAEYAAVPATDLPRAPAGQPLPSSNTALTRILIGSCNDEERDSPALAHIAQEKADLFLMIGDNVYGDRDGQLYANNRAGLEELRQSFADLAERPEFQAVRARHPMMVTWDDHDYGANDAGRDFPFRAFAERAHERFWGLDAMSDVAGRPGTYYARSFGPKGQRVQIIMLDTRFFRSPLKPTDRRGAPGRERYLPQDSEDQDMLGAAQWAWLSHELKKPADLRLIVSSIQVLPEVHGYEAWATLPAERQTLLDMVKTHEAKGVVFISGDRHTGFLYKDTSTLPYAAYELTSSSLNLSFADKSNERDTRQIGAGFAKENYGDIAIDWQARTLFLKLHDATGRVVRGTLIPFADIGL